MYYSEIQGCMEVEKKKVDIAKKENEIVYSKSIKAGKRIYYLDVKRSKNDDLFIAITESKKRVSGLEQDTLVTFEKHKIFLYKEDFAKFMEGLQDVIGFIKSESPVNDIPDFGTETPLQIGKEVSEIAPRKSFFKKFKF